MTTTPSQEPTDPQYSYRPDATLPEDPWQSPQSGTTFEYPAAPAYPAQLPGSNPPPLLGSNPAQLPGGNPPPGYPPPGYLPPGYGQPGFAMPGGYAPPMGPYPMVDAYGRPMSDKSKVVAGVLQLALGGFGAGRFYIGDNSTAITQLIVTIVTCGIGHIWGIIDGIMILVNGGVDAQGRVLRD